MTGVNPAGYIKVAIFKIREISKGATVISTKGKGREDLPALFKEFQVMQIPLIILTMTFSIRVNPLCTTLKDPKYINPP
jgi:hypothetical protein